MKHVSKNAQITRLPWALATVLLLCLVGWGCASAGSAAPDLTPPPPPPPPAAVGTWMLKIETPVGTQEPSFVISGDASALAGVMSSPQGDLPVENLVFADPTLTFAMNIDAGGQQLALQFSGKIEGDALTGTFTSVFGDIPVTGTRAP